MDKLLIVDDDYLVREGLRMAIDWQSVGVEVVGTAENGGEGLEKARELCPAPKHSAISTHSTAFCALSARPCP